MSELTFSQMVEAEEKKLAANAPALADPVPTTPTRSPANRVSPSVEQVNYGKTGSFVLGAIDTITFGHADEAGAWIDSSLPDWMVQDRYKGKDYTQILRMNREELDGASESNPGTFFTGQLAGGFVPIFGWGGRAKAAYTGAKAARSAAVSKAVMSGAAYGGLYGYGSSESEDYFTFDRLKDGAEGAAFGAAGGFILQSAIVPIGRAGVEKLGTLFRSGKVPTMKFDFKTPKAAVGTTDDVLDDIADIAKRETPKGPKSPKADDAVVSAGGQKNTLTGQADDLLEDGALFSTKELRIGGEQPRTAILNRIAALTPAQAKVAAGKLEKAMASGDLAKDPHFRSILGLDLSKVTDEVGDAVDAATVFAEMSTALLEKAKMGKKTVQGMEREIRKQFGGEISETELDRLVQQVSETQGSAHIGSTVQALAGVQFARATKELMPEVLKGTVGAREQLAEQLSRAIRVSAKGQFLLSEAGRNLGMTSHKRNLAFVELRDGKAQVETREAVTARVNAALKKLNDDELNELLARVKNLSDLNEVQKVLGDPEDAAMVSNWIRARNSAGLFLKSNSLTPMSGIINTVSWMMHSPMRNYWSAKLAAAYARRSGEHAQALVFEIQNNVRRAVRWQSHIAGLKAAGQRMKWEWLDSKEKIAGTALGTKAAARASASRQAMIANGYQPPQIREFDRTQRLAVQDVRGFNEKLAQRAEDGGGFATFINGMERAGAAALNTVDALGTATARLVSGVGDDWGRAYVNVQHVYSESAAQAVEEGVRKGLNDDALINYVQKRTGELAEMPPMEILQRVERKLIDGDDLADDDLFLLNRDLRASAEADATLFMDGPQTAGGKVAASAAGYLDKVAGGFAIPGILMTYIRTPIRILERGLVSYTPWAHHVAETQKILARGGRDAAMERARIDIGTTIMGVGMMAGASGAITVTNGGYRNSANLEGAPPQRVNLPDGGFVEISRLDPFALTIALGAIAGQAWKKSQEAEERFGHDEAIGTAMSYAIHGMRDAIFEKSYMTGAQELIEAMTSQSDTAGVDYVTKLGQDAIARMIPLSGTSRQLNETLSGQTMEAVGFIDKLMKVTPGLGGYLPARIDPLGNEVENRMLGLAAGTTSDVDPVTKQLAALDVNITSLRKADPAGFDLTSEELSEIRRIRGNEATNRDGLTMKQALDQLFRDPTFQTLSSKDAVSEAVVDTMRSFNASAREIFESRNQQYLADREGSRSFKEYIANNIDRDTAARAASQEVVSAGLPAPTRIPD